MSKIIDLLFLLKLFSLISAKSLTFVMDTSNTMIFETKYIADALTKFDVANYVDDYLLVPFNHSEVGPVTLTNCFEEFKSLVSNIAPGGKRQCTNLVLEALQRALEKSSPESHIYLFSDAQVEDGSTIYDIKQLCKETNSRVSIIDTRTCLPQESNLDDTTTSVYQDIADTCGGQLMTFTNPYNLRNVFKFIEPVIQWDTIDFSTEHSIRCDGYEHQVSVDSYVAEVLILFIGDVYSAAIKNQYGDNEAVNLINSKKFKAFHIKEPNQIFRVTCRSRDNAIIKIGECTHFDFKLGFSPIKPSIMKETTSKPMPNQDWFILIESLIADLQPKEIEVVVSGKEEKVYKLVQTHRGSSLYVSESFRVPDKAFRIIIIATDGTGVSTRHKSPLIPVQVMVTKGTPAPCTGTVIDIYEDNNLVDYGSDRHLVCKVTGYPAPNIWWTTSNKNAYVFETKALELLEHPNVFLSYFYVKNITNNATYQCNYNNKEGGGNTSTEIFVTFTSKFIVMEMPKDQVIDVYSKGTLNCVVDAFPSATVKWYLNDTLLTYKDNVDMRDGSLTIKNMNFDDIGTYTCEVDNSIEKKIFSAEISISGLEFPSVSIDREDVIEVKAGAALEIECTAQGKPEPEIRWSFRTNMSLELEELPRDVSVFGGNLKINVVRPHHKGFYRCEAINNIGSDCLDVEIQTGSPPIIEEGASFITVRERQRVEIPCKVESSSAPQVWWEFYQAGTNIPLDNRHITDLNHTHSFEAWWKDAGVYRCIAQNEEGRAERDVTVDVQVAPYIKPPNPKTAHVLQGKDYNLPCIIEYGKPNAKLSWKFRPKNSIRTQDLRWTADNLVLKNFSLWDEGEYICSAQNEFGYDEIKYYIYLKSAH